MKEGYMEARKWPCVTTHVVLGIIVFVIALAIAASIAAHEYPSFLAAAQPYVDFMDRLFHTRRMASRSNFVEIGSIYYSIAIAVLPCSLVYFFVYLYFPPKWSLGDRYRTSQRLMALPASLFLVTFSVLVIYSMEGQDLRYIQLGSSLFQLLVLGWGVFAFCGFLVSFSMIVVWKAISDH